MKELLWIESSCLLGEEMKWITQPMKSTGRLAIASLQISNHALNWLTPRDTWAEGAMVPGARVSPGISVMRVPPCRGAYIASRS